MIQAASLHDIKKELQSLSPGELAELCLALAKYKKDNKELLGYLLFRSQSKDAFILDVKAEIDEQFAELGGQSNLYHAKKSLRKILRQVTKYCKYMNDKAASAELHIYFCMKLKSSDIAFRKSQQLLNMYEQQLKKINGFVSALHEDLQSDYQNDLESIAL